MTVRCGEKEEIQVNEMEPGRRGPGHFLGLIIIYTLDCVVGHCPEAWKSVKQERNVEITGMQYLTTQKAKRPWKRYISPHQYDVGRVQLNRH